MANDKDFKEKELNFWRAGGANQKTLQRYWYILEPHKELIYAEDNLLALMRSINILLVNMTFQFLHILKYIFWRW